MKMTNDRIIDRVRAGLAWDSEIRGGYLDVEVEDGWVTVKGDVDFQFQSDLALDDVAGHHGVTRRHERDPRRRTPLSEEHPSSTATPR